MFCLHHFNQPSLLDGEAEESSGDDSEEGDDEPEDGDDLDSDEDEDMDSDEDNVSNPMFLTKNI